MQFSNLESIIVCPWTGCLWAGCPWAGSPWIVSMDGGQGSGCPWTLIGQCRASWMLFHITIFAWVGSGPLNSFQFLHFVPKFQSPEWGIPGTKMILR